MCTITEKLNEYPKKHGKTIETLADELGYESPSTLARHLNPNDHMRPFPLKALIPIIKACNNDCTVLDHIETALGRVAFSVSKNNETVDLKSLSNLAEASGAAMSTMAKTLADGKIDEEEKKALRAVFLTLSQRVNVIMGGLN